MVNLPKASEYQDEGEDDSTTGAHYLSLKLIIVSLIYQRYITIGNPNYFNILQSFRVKP